MFTTMVFAAGDSIDLKNPLAQVGSNVVIVDQYGEFEDELNPQSPPNIEITDKALPQTGGIPAEAFYIVGGICILSAVLLLTKKTKSSTK